tara:strand:+ start:1376 stop:2299 length:924 start_codon:yes stop_codon:yes gene_type:complete
MRKLPVFATVGEVLSGVTRHYFQLLFVAWPAAVVLLAAVVVLGWRYSSVGYLTAFDTETGEPDVEALKAAAELLASGNNIWWTYGAQLVLGLASAIAAVRWHRLVLFGEGANDKEGLVALRKEDGTYLWALLKIIPLGVGGFIMIDLITLLLTHGETNSEVLNVVAGLLTLFLFLFAYGIWLRLLLALPDASVGAGGRVLAVFRASVENTSRLVAVSLLMWLALFMVIFVIYSIIRLAGGAMGITSVSDSTSLMVAILVIGVAAYIYFVMAQVTMLSVAYREIVGLPAVSHGRSEGSTPPDPTATHA